MATWNHVVGGWIEAEVAIAQYGRKGMMWADEYVNFCHSDLSIKKVCWNSVIAHLKDIARLSIRENHFNVFRNALEEVEIIGSLFWPFPCKKKPNKGTYQLFFIHILRYFCNTYSTYLACRVLGSLCQKNTKGSHCLKPLFFLPMQTWICLLNISSTCFKFVVATLKP